MTRQHTNYKQTEIGEIPKEWLDNGLEEYLGYIYSCLNILYNNEYHLFKNNLSERCITFRFAHHMQNVFGPDYYVDCDYNSSTYYNSGMKRWERRNGKPIQDQKTGKPKKRFIDIIVHKRKAEFDSDLICFEIKKWNNCTTKSVKKDLNNLKVLTTRYGYLFGFHLVFGKTVRNTRITVLRDGVRRERF